MIEINSAYLIADYPLAGGTSLKTTTGGPT